MRTAIFFGLWFLGESIGHFSTAPSVSYMMGSIAIFCLFLDISEHLRKGLI